MKLRHFINKAYADFSVCGSIGVDVEEAEQCGGLRALMRIGFLAVYPYHLPGYCPGVKPNRRGRARKRRSEVRRQEEEI